MLPPTQHRDYMGSTEPTIGPCLQVLGDFDIIAQLQQWGRWGGYKTSRRCVLPTFLIPPPVHHSSIPTDELISRLEEWSVRQLHHMRRPLELTL